MADSTQSTRQASLSRAKWTFSEEMWLVVNSMYPKRTPKWLAEHMPNKTRSENAINGHLGDMRTYKRLPKAWRSATWKDASAWTLEEDAEALMWYVSDRKFIDVSIFLKNNRAGKAVRKRARYLARDVELITRVKTMEEILREMTLVRDTAAAADSTVGDEEIARMDEKLRQIESNGWEKVQLLIYESLEKRPDTFDVNNCIEEE